MRWVVFGAVIDGGWGDSSADVCGNDDKPNETTFAPVMTNIEDAGRNSRRGVTPGPPSPKELPLCTPPIVSKCERPAPGRCDASEPAPGRCDASQAPLCRRDACAPAR